MGRGKNVEKVPPEILYAGALKKLFDPIAEANFPIRVANLARSGRMYKIKKGNATRQWKSRKLGKTKSLFSMLF
jgi:hypothetical protein